MGDSASRELGKRHPYPGEIARILGQKPSLRTKPILGPKPGGLLGLGLDPKHKSVNPEAWKDAIGAKMVPARLALLPEAKPRWDRIGLSAGGQLAILTVLLLLPQIFPDEMNTALRYTYVELMQPVTEIPVAPEPEPPPPPPPKPPKIKAKVKIPPPKPVEPELKTVLPEPVPELVPVKLNPTQPHIC